MSTLSGCGIGLRKEHFDVVLEQRPAVPFFEVISENFMIPGGRPRHVLEQLRPDYPIALHGVSMSLGSAEPLNLDYLRALRALADRIEPAVISDHLCWTALGGHNSHDLLPLAYTEETVRQVAGKIMQAQDFLGRRILIENISSYVEFNASTMGEAEFVRAVAEAADCHILLDINNLYVNARNHGIDPVAYLDTLPAARVRQFHLAGHEDHGEFVIDTHDHPVSEPVWSLYRKAVQRFGAVPALIEWDAEVPPFAVVRAQARAAEALARVVLARGARAGERRERRASPLATRRCLRFAEVTR